MSRLILSPKVLLASISLAVVASTASAQGQVFAPVVTDWIVTVQQGWTATECATQILTETGYEVKSVFDAISVLVVETPTTDSSRLDGIACIKSYEVDGIVGPLGVIN